MRKERHRKIERKNEKRRKAGSRKDKGRDDKSERSKAKRKEEKKRRGEISQVIYTFHYVSNDHKSWIHIRHSEALPVPVGVCSEFLSYAGDALCKSTRLICMSCQNDNMDNDSDDEMVKSVRQLLRPCQSRRFNRK